MTRKEFLEYLEELVADTEEYQVFEDDERALIKDLSEHDMVFGSLMAELEPMMLDHYAKLKKRAREILSS